MLKPRDNGLLTISEIQNLLSAEATHEVKPERERETARKKQRDLKSLRLLRNKVYHLLHKKDNCKLINSVRFHMNSGP